MIFVYFNVIVIGLINTEANLVVSKFDEVAVHSFYTFSDPMWGSAQKLGISSQQFRYHID